MLLRRYHDRTSDTDPEASDTTSDTGAGTTDEPETTKVPARSASKAEWVAYAVASGADQDDAEKLTKDELITQYGEG
ncbi:hypothetical protein [Streptomyces sp. NPDC002644]